MGSLKSQLQDMERAALTSAVLSECRRVCYLLGMEESSDIAEVEQEALRIIANPTLPPRLTMDEIQRSREDMYGAARARGIEPETVKPEIEAVRAQKG